MATKKTEKTTGRRFVLVTTEFRGVFVGYLPDGTDTAANTVTLEDARMVIRFGTTRGLFELCATGPTQASKISSKAPSVELRKVTSVVGISPAAAAAWEAVQ